MAKIIREILRLLWKVVREVFWKWLKPLLGKFLLLTGIFIAAIMILVMMVVRSC